MKYALILAGILPVCLLQGSAHGQDATATNAESGAAPSAPSNPASAAAERDGLDEKFKRLAADIESLRGANQALMNKLSALQDQMQDIRREQTRLAANTGVQDDLKTLAHKIEEVDQKRQDDKDAISAEIKKSGARLEKLLADAAAPPKAVSQIKAPPATENGTAEPGFVYVIQDGDNLGEIVKAYNADFKSKGLKQITRRAAMDANPNVDWTHLKVGQKIVIPRPPE